MYRSSSILSCSETETVELAAFAPLAATAGTPMPGNTESPTLFHHNSLHELFNLLTTAEEALERSFRVRKLRLPRPKCRAKCPHVSPVKPIVIPSENQRLASVIHLPFVSDRGCVHDNFGPLADVRDRSLNRLPKKVTSRLFQSLVLGSAAEICPQVIGLREI